MTPLIDADILLHEIGWSGEFKDKETGEGVLLPFDHVQELLDDKIKFICEDVNATDPPILFITNSEWITNSYNKRAKWTGKKPIKFKPVFRYDIAKTKPYKGNRKNPKPFHFYNIVTYLMDNYNVVISEDGLEADDMICIEQTKKLGNNEDTVICSRDKDLRICPGWHFSWECGKQSAIGPMIATETGWLEKNDKGKILGCGLMFFYFQMLVGDSADNIPGCPGWGQVKSYNALKDLSLEETIKFVKDAYKANDKIENSKEYFLEQANLLWMIREKGKGYKLV